MNIATETMEVTMATPNSLDESSQDDLFHDTLNRLMGHTNRPKTDEDEKNLKILLAALVDLCGTNESKWKSFVLAVTYKRYHLKSPEAKISLQEAMELADKSQDGNDKTVGNGERKIFYLAIVFLFQCLLEGGKNNQESIASALKCLLDIAPFAGGCRDICTLIEKLAGVLLSSDQMQEKRIQTKEFFGSESMSLLVAYAVEHCTNLENQEAKAALDQITRMAATALEEDKKILEARETVDKDDSTVSKLPSTLHVFLPHRDRGKPSKKVKNPKKVPNRQLINSVAEILIWSQTSIMSANQAFSGSFGRLQDAASMTMSKDSKDKAKASLQTMQTIIRNERKGFNHFARSQGFMLSDLFQQDKTALTYSQIVRGKDGDINALTRLAAKSNSTDVLRMVNARFASNPSKITRFGSIRELVQAWAASSKMEMQDEVWELERGILVARLKATVKFLRGTYKSTDRATVLASLDSNVDSHAAALLVGAAMCKWEIEIPVSATVKTATQATVEENGSLGEDKNGLGVSKSPSKSPDKKRQKTQSTAEADSTDMDLVMTVSDLSDDGCQLHLPGGIVRNLNSFQKVCDLLTSLVASDPVIFPSMAESDGSATSKAVVNLLEKHLLKQGRQTLLLFSSANLELPVDLAKAMVEQDCSIHKHDVDDIQLRLDREGAKRGDITISLSWDTHDDLDLHVILPNETEVAYFNKVSVEGKAYLDVDMNAWHPLSSEPVENVIVGDLDKKEEAPWGRYVVVVQNYCRRTKGEAGIPFFVVIDKDGKKEKLTGECSGSGVASNVKFEFEYNGRAKPFVAEDGQMSSGEKASSVNITTSVGQTLEALVEAVKALGQQEQMNAVRQLVDDQEKKEDAVRPIASATYDVTNRDRNQVLLFKLPARFHVIVNTTFGGNSLADEAATSIAKRMVQDKINIGELKTCGYPADIIESVSAKMKVV